MNGDNDDLRETISPRNNNDEIPGIPSLPSLTQSTSETEEERRRILEGIFAEEDDEEEDVLAFLGDGNGAPPPPPAAGDGGRDDCDGGDDDGVNASVGNGDAAADGGTGNDVDGMPLGQEPERQPPRDADEEGRMHHDLLTNKAVLAAAAAARKLRISDNAFSSSSEEEEFDEGFEEFHRGPGQAGHGASSADAGAGLVDFVGPAVTPRSSNTTRPMKSDVGGDGGNDDSPSQQQQQPDDLMDQFSWIHSADSGDDHREGEEVQGPLPTLSLRFSEDTASFAGHHSANKSPPSSATSCGNRAANDGAGKDTLTSSSQQQHRQQSAFDRALNEVKQQNSRPGSNSFSFANLSPVEDPAGEEDGEGGDAGAGAGAGATTHNTAMNDMDAQLRETLGIMASSNNKGDEKEAEDDFFAKAEHTVLDEIFSENFENEDDADSRDRDRPTGSDGGGPRGAKPAAKGASKRASARAKSSTASSPNAGGKNSASAGTRIKDRISLHTNNNSSVRNNNNNSGSSQQQLPASGLPDVLSSMRQKIESLNIFDGDMSAVGKSSVAAPPGNYDNPNYAHHHQQGGGHPHAGGSMLAIDASSSLAAPAALQKYYASEEEREDMRRAFQQSISAAVLVSLAHKRYERRRLAAMEIEKVVRSLVAREDYPRVRAILLLLSDDYVRSTNEDARKGGAVALAACAIGLKKADEGRADVAACRDLILASVVHACQDHSQRVRYYATESLFNVTKVMPSLAVRHFFILFEILRSLYADVDLDVRSGAELLDKKLKEVIVGAINSGSFSADACVPVFARFVCMRNKATKQLTLTWLKEFSEKLIGAPILQFLHLFLGGIFAMVADPNAAIRQLALEFLQLVLPKLLVNNEDFEDGQQMKVDFDKILQSLVLTMEHPDPFVRKVAMYWMSRIVQAHMSSAFPSDELNRSRGEDHPNASVEAESSKGDHGGIGMRASTAASVSVRNALPHVLPGILLSIGDTHQSRTNKDSFLPDQTTHSLAEQANTCLQDAVRRDGRAFVPHLGGFIVALREELDSPGGLIARNPPSLERRPYRMDVKADGSGIESTGWYRASDGVEERDNALILGRLCALQWVVVLYEHVVPDSLKERYASEFVDCIIYQLVDQPPGIIVVKSFEVLAKVSNPAEGEESHYAALPSTKALADKDDAPIDEVDVPSKQNPMTDENANFALGILEPSRRKLLSRDRGVFASLIDLHSKHQKLLMDISKVIELMCTLQPAEFVFVSFAYELDNFIVSRMKHREKILDSPEADSQTIKQELASFARDLAFVSNFAQQLGIVFFAAPETEQLRGVLKDSIGFEGETVRDERRARLFHILLYTFSHNIVATLAFCLWGGAFLTASTFLQRIDPLDVSLMFYLEIDQLIDLIERPLFRHLHLRMLECEDILHQEGSGAMLFRTLKSIMMLLPQSTSYMILKERLTSTARYRQSAVALSGLSRKIDPGSNSDVFVKRIVSVRRLHCDAKWRNIRAESLEEPCRTVDEDQKLNAAQQRREWLGYADEDEELAAKEKMKQNMLGNTPKKVELVGVYENLNEMQAAPQLELNENEECDQCVTSPTTKGLIKRFEQMSAGDERKEGQTKPQWREYWASRQ